MNLNNYIKTVLSGVKTWALSTFANKRDFDDLNSRMYYSEQVEKFFFKNQQISPMDSYGNYVNMSFLEKKCDEIRVGDTLNVVWDGTEYECKVFYYDEALMIGNKSIVGTIMGESFVDTGEPFVISIWNGYEVGFYYTDMVSESHVVSISGMVEKVHQIESKYINMPLATQAKPGAVHPWINDDDQGMPVWMHPRTGELYTYDNYYELPIATSTSLGGVKPIAKTDVMTQEVGVDSTGKLYAMPSAQADWDSINESSADYIKNKPRIGNDYIILTDKTDGFDYMINIDGGNLVTYKVQNINNVRIVKMPNKTIYAVGDAIDLTGIELSIVYADGSEKTVSNYLADIEYVTSSTNAIKVFCKEDGQSATVSIPIIVNPFDPAIELIDFQYKVNNNGTYTLTGWKQTLNGVPSTELIIPNNQLIIL